MNNKRYTHSLLLLLPALLLFSCEQEDIPGVDGGTDGSEIVFRVALPDVESRSDGMTAEDDLNDAGFHVTAFYPEGDANGAFNPYLADLFAKPLEDKPGYFGIFDDQASDPYVWPSTRHGKLGRLKFFAFYPSCESMRNSIGGNSDNFVLENKSTKQGATVTYDYRMKKFKVNNDMSNHIDFVTATAEGSKRVNGADGVRLVFEHQLSRVVLQAWGNTTNDIEIAGVRIGRAVTESDFNFAATPTLYKPGDNTTTGNWISPQVKGCVEYIFREGDAVVKIGRGNHTTEGTAVSIMGNAEWAIIIPSDYTGWNNSGTAKQKQGLYFSVLLRVKEKDESNTMVYPYVIGGSISATISADDMNVVFLSVNSKTGKVVKRLYRNKENAKYYTDRGLTEAYTLPAGEEIRNYGWAAVPLTDYRWKPGYQYTYKLNYSNGVGVHDPDDPLPGYPIISKIPVGVTEGQTTWPQVLDNYTDGEEVDVTGNIIVE